MRGARRRVPFLLAPAIREPAKLTCQPLRLPGIPPSLLRGMKTPARQARTKGLIPNARNTRRLGAFRGISSQALNHLFGFCQPATIKPAGDVDGRDGLASRGEFAQSLLLLAAVKRLQMSEILSQGNWIGDGCIGTK